MQQTLMFFWVQVFADKRYNRLDKRSKMPQWVSDNLLHSHLNLSTEMVHGMLTRGFVAQLSWQGVSLARAFLKEMAQPFSLTAQLGKALWTVEMVEKQPTSKRPAFLPLTSSSASAPPTYYDDDHEQLPSSSASSSGLPPS